MRYGIAAGVVLWACSACFLPRSDDCTYVESATWGEPGTVSVRAEVVASGLEVPWALAFLPDGSTLVTERPGRLRRILADGTLVAETIAGIPSVNVGEGGLQGMALHPDFASNRLFYLYYTASVGPAGAENRVERFRLSEDFRSAASDKVVVSGIPAAPAHNGGRIRFGPDRMLYVGTGDAATAPRAPAPNTLGGKLLRLTPDGDIPADNPNPRSRIFANGIRNTQGFDWFDDETVALTDHGPSGDTFRTGDDELTLIQAGDNLGWPTLTGCRMAPGLRHPLMAWKNALPPGGASFYRGTAIPEWTGSLIISALGARHLHRVKLSADGSRVEKAEVYLRGEAPNGLGRLREAIMGPDGHLWVTTSNCDDRGTCPAQKDVVARILPGAVP
jgi:glucose/arabinose dehydrogenase